MGPHVTDADVLILGQGLAGSTLAWRLAERGVSVVVVDRGGLDAAGRPSASRVAAGLVTPVTGKRLTVAEGFETQWGAARAFYRGVEKRTGRQLLSEQPSLRVFLDEAERATFERRALDASFGRHARLATSAELPRGVSAPLGGFVMPGAARLQVAAYLKATRSWLADERRLAPVDLDVTCDFVFDAERVQVPRLGVSVKRLVLCQGYTSQSPQELAPIRLAPVKGEVLTIEAPGLSTEAVTHAGVWLAPEGEGRFRVGSTTDRERIDSVPTAAGREELLRRIAARGVAVSSVVEHVAAVRPATSDRRPTYGFCPERPRVGWFNGLGAKGGLWAPFYADRMAEIIARSLPG